MKKIGKNKKRLLRKGILLFLLLSLLVGTACLGWNALSSKYTVTYDSYTATTGSISNTLSFSGNLSLIDSAELTAPAATSVRTVYVSAGDKVAQGDKLMRLANGATIKAAFDGTVNAVYVNEGDAVSAGEALIQIADFSHMSVSLRVDEYDIGKVSVGRACTVTVTSNERKYASEIASVSHISSSGGSVAYYTAVVYVDVQDEETLPGMQVNISIPQEEAANAVILKVDALSFDESNQAYVWMADASGALKRVDVKTGVSNGNYAEITEGLSDGDEVFVEVQKEETSAVSDLLSGLFGQQQINGRSNSRAGFAGGMTDSGRASGMSSTSGGAGSRDRQSGGGKK